MEPDREKSGPRLVLLSGERTLLAWQRLALAFMGLGFVLDRFGFYIRTISADLEISWLPEAYTFWMGLALVVAGTVASAASGFIYTRFRLRYARREYAGPGGSVTLGAAMAALTTVVGLVTAVFLFMITH